MERESTNTGDDQSEKDEQVLTLRFKDIIGCLSLMEYLQRFRETYRREMENKLRQSCIDLRDVIQYNVTRGVPDVGDDTIGKTESHQMLNRLLGRRYWTGCPELVEFIRSYELGEDTIQAEYVSKFSRNPLRYY